MGRYKGEGGVEWEFDEPLTELMQEKVTKGYLTKIEEEEEVEEEGKVVYRPSTAASKADWVMHAVHHPDESRRLTVAIANDMSKADLVERYRS
jgi:hypothetical protein